MKLSEKVKIANEILMLNERRFESKKYIEKYGSYDKNMIQEIGLNEVIEGMDRLDFGKIPINKDLIHTIMDNIKRNVNWYKYKNIDGLFEKDGVIYD